MILHFNHSKTRGRHTTLIELALNVVKTIINLECIDGISYGHIVSGKKASGGHRMVTVGKHNGGITILTIRQPGALQTLNVYTDTGESAAIEIKQRLSKKGIQTKDK